MATIFSKATCELGEGPLWHPEENALYWFDIIGKRLYRSDGKEETHWQFDEHVSAAGWVDKGALLIASETALFRFETATGARHDLVALEADDPVTRSNDGRADPWGGFWIGTMGKKAEAGAGAIYRYLDGKLHKLFDRITISNAICFAPDGAYACFSDTPTRRILRVALDKAGFPTGEPETYLDLNGEGLNPDGAVIDAEGNLWNAQWGAARVACYAPDGRFLRAVEVGGQHSSCPAFGGADLATMFVTTAAEGIEAPGEGEGRVYTLDPGATGQKEHRVRI